jgi:hypothetical protein
MFDNQVVIPCFLLHLAIGAWHLIGKPAPTPRAAVAEQGAAVSRRTVPGGSQQLGRLI